MREIPEVKGFVHRCHRIGADGTIGYGFAFWCPYCHEFHYHGWTDTSLRKRTDGHRVAHCSNMDSPYRETGYFLVRFKRKELEEFSKLVYSEEYIRERNRG